MNYLAHLFLSGDDEELLLGNFIADAVKGKQELHYNPNIVRGIKLHRAIDQYTDTHPVVSETKERLRVRYKKYAPVIADMFYDHFLASRFERYAAMPLAPYTEQVYNILHKNYSILPERVQHFFPHMRQHNWLLSYAQLSGIGQALTGMSRRTTFHSGMETAVEELEANYTLCEDEFTRFFPELMRYAEEVRGNCLNQDSQDFLR